MLFKNKVKPTVEDCFTINLYVIKIVVGGPK